MARSLQKIVLEQREELRRLLAQDVLVHFRDAQGAVVEDHFKLPLR